MLVRSILVVATLAMVGCSDLFPVLGDNSSTTTTTTADAGTQILSGKVCQLSDLRSPSSCTTAAANRTITVGENGATATSASDGSFTVDITNTGTATLVVTNATDTSQSSAPTVSVLTSSTLTSAIKSGVLLPSVDAQVFSNVELDNGAYDNATGAIIAWVVSASGAAVSGAEAVAISGAVGPLYDISDASELAFGSHTGSYGTVSFLNVPPGIAPVEIAAPASSGLAGDTFELQVIAGAVTVSALSLPASTVD